VHLRIGQLKRDPLRLTAPPLLLVSRRRRLTTRAIDGRS
jgi:hypothetical protein